MLPGGLAAALETALGAAPRSARPVSGGDINDAFAVELVDGRRVFVKTHPAADRRMFPVEALALSWLAEADAIRLPEVLASSETPGEGPAFLALELIESAPRARDFEERLGRELAALHRAAPASFGWDRDGFIGSLPQPNRPQGDWASFYGRRRLAHQTKRASERGLVGATLRSRLEALIDALPSLVGPPEPPSRLHGDLWGGNLHVDERGGPCLIDPAPYGGHREVDLAMMRLFGGFGPRVFDAYDEAFPLAPDHAARVPLYQLYPLLVHVNLFGGSYGASVERAVSAMGY